MSTTTKQRKVSLWDRLRGRRQEEREAVAKSFDDLAEAIAGGAEPDVAEVEQVLGAAGASAEDLRNAVGRRQEGNRLRAVIATGEEILEASQRLAEVIAGAEFEKAKTLELFDRQLAALAAKREELRARRLDVDAAGRALRDLFASDERVRRLNDRLAELHRRRDKSVRLFGDTLPDAKEAAGDVAKLESEIAALNDQVGESRDLDARYRLGERKLRLESELIDARIAADRAADVKHAAGPRAALEAEIERVRAEIDKLRASFDAA